MSFNNPQEVAADGPQLHHWKAHSDFLTQFGDVGIAIRNHCKVIPCFPNIQSANHHSKLGNLGWIDHFGKGNWRKRSVICGSLCSALLVLDEERVV
jgi:hypothetical protein